MPHSNIELRFKFALAALGLIVLLLGSCNSEPQTSNGAQNDLPNKVLWAWERPENLEFVDPNRYAVAFLAQTLILESNEVLFRPRRQPLKVNPQTKLIAVTRIESAKFADKQAALSDEQKTQLLELTLKTLARQNVAAIQIDFDAAVSEREFYRELLLALREKLPREMPLSITALASGCLGDRWFGDLPVAEAVPMIFRMGADDQKIKNYLANNHDFNEPLCRRSYGVALDEVFAAKLDPRRRLYVFNNRSWTPGDVERIAKVFR